MGVTEVLRLIRRRWPILVAAMLIGVIGAYGYLKTVPVTYSASSTCYVSMATGTSVNDSYQGGLAAQERVRSYLELADSETVAQKVKDQLGLPISAQTLRGRITATSPPATTLIVISVTDSTPDGARRLADEAVSQFRALVAQLESIQVNQAPAARIAVVDAAALPSAPSSPKRSRILLMGLLAGIVLGGAAALARERLDRRLRTSADVAAVLPAPILGIIDDGRPGAPGELRRLRTRLGPGAKTILLTSLSRDSVPEVAIGLARTLADTGASVALVDADTTGHGSSAHVPVPATPGLTGLLHNGTPLDDAISDWDETGIAVLPLGDRDFRTADLLAGPRFGELMSKLRSEYDHIVMQGAPVAAAADAITLAIHCDTTLGVIELGSTTSGQVRGAVATFGEPNLSGAVVFSRTGSTLRKLLARIGNRR